MNVITTKLSGVVIIEPDVFGDSRGFFLETYHEEKYMNEVGIKERFVQDNHSRSAKGVLRGLHLQLTKPQGKLVRCPQGEVFDVAVDVNPDSETYCQWVGVTLTGENHRQFYIPPGYAHAFVVLSDMADFNYKCTEFYYPEDEGGYRWNDPAFGINWPIEQPLLSAKDKAYPLIADR